MVDLGCVNGRPWTAAEESVLRRKYGDTPARQLGAELDRSFASITKRARLLGLVSKRRWTDSDDKKLIDLWGTMSVRKIALQLGRTYATTYWRAGKLGLERGCPQGSEYLSRAARRTGYATAQLRKILRAGGVRFIPSASRPTKARRHYQIVDSFDVDRAVEAWLARETVGAAARTRGLVADTLAAWLRLARSLGFDVPSEPSKWKHRWYVPTATIDAVIAWRGTIETISAAARRVHVNRWTLVCWLTESGVARSRTKPWYVDVAVVDRVVADRRARARRAA